MVYKKIITAYCETLDMQEDILWGKMQNLKVTCTGANCNQ
jgi:hypothetical protein